MMILINDTLICNISRGKNFCIEVPLVVIDFGEMH